MCVAYLLKNEGWYSNKSVLTWKISDTRFKRFLFQLALSAPTTSDNVSGYPTGLSSWRGSYAELALNFSFVGYGMPGYIKTDGPDLKELTVTEFLAILKSAIGKTYTGWKGGDFVMGKNTPIWVANDGNSGNTAVIGVRDDEYAIILETAHTEY
jgi:hypothetical protein